MYSFAYSVGDTTIHAVHGLYCAREMESATVSTLFSVVSALSQCEVVKTTWVQGCAGKVGRQQNMW